MESGVVASAVVGRVNFERDGGRSWDNEVVSEKT
jgi:hypothetical protein